MRQSFRAVCFCSMMLLASAPVLANSIEAYAFRSDTNNDGVADMYVVELAVEHDDVTAVQLVTAGGAFSFDQEDSGSFWLEGEFGSLAEFNAAVGGTHTLSLTHSAGVTEYAATFAAISDEMFPAIPVLGPVGATIPQQYSFNWTWAGNADVVHIGASINDDTDDLMEIEDDSMEGELDLDNTFSYDVDFAPFSGYGEFEVAYAYVGDLLSGIGPVTNLQLASGIELFNPDEDSLMGFIVSEDVAEFTTGVPEPTSAAMLAFGSLALVRRKRR